MAGHTGVYRGLKKLSKLLYPGTVGTNTLYPKNRKKSTMKHLREGSLVGRLMQSNSGVDIGLELPGTPYEHFPRSLMSSRVSSTYSVASSIYDSGDDSDTQKPHLVEL